MPADETGVKVVSGTLSTTVAEAVEMTARVNEIVVINRDATNTAWARVFPGLTSASMASFVAPVAAADECIPILPSSARTIWRSSKAQLCLVGIVGSGGAYTIEGRAWLS